MNATVVVHVPGGFEVVVVAMAYSEAAAAAYPFRPTPEAQAANWTVYWVDLAVVVVVAIHDLLRVVVVVVVVESEALVEEVVVVVVGEDLGDAAPSQMYPVCCWCSWVPQVASADPGTCYREHRLAEERIPWSAAAPFRAVVASSVLNLGPA